MKPQLVFFRHCFYSPEIYPKFIFYLLLPCNKSKQRVWMLFFWKSCPNVVGLTFVHADAHHPHETTSIWTSLQAQWHWFRDCHTTQTALQKKVPQNVAVDQDTGPHKSVVLWTIASFPFKTFLHFKHRVSPCVSSAEHNWLTEKRRHEESSQNSFRSFQPASSLLRVSICHTTVDFFSDSTQHFLAQHVLSKLCKLTILCFLLYGQNSSTNSAAAWFECGGLMYRQVCAVCSATQGLFLRQLECTQLLCLEWEEIETRSFPGSQGVGDAQAPDFVSCFLCDLRGIRCWRALDFWATKTRLPKQITYRSCPPKVCVHLFHGQEEHQIDIFWAFWLFLGWG